MFEHWDQNIRECSSVALFRAFGDMTATVPTGFRNRTLRAGPGISGPYSNKINNRNIVRNIKFCFHLNFFIKIIYHSYGQKVLSKKKRS